MTAPSKPSEPSETRGLTIRWQPDEFAKITEAARVKAQLEGYPVSPTDIIRSGALRRADEILGAA